MQNRFALSTATAALLLITAAVPLAAQQPANPRLDSIFAHFDAATPGCALGVFRDGRVEYARGYGLASLEHGVPITPASVFHVASVSKHFTVTAIALLAEDGRLSLDDDIRRHLPEMHDFGTPITIRHLIHHTSGLRDQWDLLSMAGWRGGDPKSMDDVLWLAARQRELNFPPGDRYLYSNTGYTLLAIIVERVSGQPLRAFAAERIFAPLGMNATVFLDEHTDVIPRRTSAYVRRGAGAFRVSMPIYDNVGATSLNTTIEDLARWDRNFYEPVVGGQSLLGILHRRGVLNSGDTISYAGALMIGELGGFRMVEHGGADAGYRAQFLRLPDARLSVAVLCNISDANPGVLARAAAMTALGASFTPLTPPAGPGSAQQQPAAPTPAPLTAAERGAYVGSYYSEELDAVWHIVEDGDRLLLRRNRFGDVALVTTGPDRFGAGRALRFTRDAAGQVDALLVSSGRVIDLRFVRR
jgi:CubicO group peptidase (beta-lactamase class C family)